jgi:hypothetical protein
MDHVLTGDAFTRMIDTATNFAVGVQFVIDCTPGPGQEVSSVRVRNTALPTLPRNGTESAARAAGELGDLISLYLLSRSTWPGAAAEHGGLDLPNSSLRAAIAELLGG